MRPIIEINRKWLVTTAWKYAKELRIDHLDNVIRPINRGLLTPVLLSVRWRPDSFFFVESSEVLSVRWRPDLALNWGPFDSIQDWHDME